MITSNLSKKTSIYDRLFLSENLAVNSILLERERERERERRAHT